MRKFACLLFVTLAVTACGKKGPLIYPDMLVPSAPSDVLVQQIGNSMKLSFLLPSKDLAGRKLDGLSGVTILKRDEPSGQNMGCSSCIADFAVFKKLNLDLLPPDIKLYGRQLMLLDGNVKSERTYTYLISAVTKDNLESKLSAPATAALITAPLPPVLQVINQPTEVHLEFVGLPPHDGVIVGYNVYRTLKGEMFPFQPLNSEVLVENRFVDIGLERGTIYVYGVRTVIRLPSGSRLESGLSNEVDAKLKDDE